MLSLLWVHYAIYILDHCEHNLQSQRIYLRNYILLYQKANIQKKLNLFIQIYIQQVWFDDLHVRFD